MSPEILTCAGDYVNFESPDPEALKPGVIAAALSRICRFSGHTKFFYSVARHSMLVATILEELGNHSLKFEGLMHDASEAFLGDVSSPLKSLLPDYRTIEKRFEEVLEAKFSLDRSITAKETVKHADLIALAIERYFLLPDAPKDSAAWACLGGIDISRWRQRQFIETSPREDQFNFMVLFNELYEGRGGNTQ